MRTVIDTIIRRRSVRSFLEQQIDDSDLEIIIQAGRYAPSGGNHQYTTFLAVQNAKILSELAEIAEEEFSKMEISDSMYQSLKNSILRSKKGGYVFHYHAPTLMILANKKGYDNAMADCAAAMENMMIAAASLGIGSCWINQLKWLSQNAVMEKYLQGLGIGNDEAVMGAVALGFAAYQRAKENRESGDLYPVTAEEAEDEDKSGKADRAKEHNNRRNRIGRTKGKRSRHTSGICGHLRLGRTFF